MVEVDARGFSCPIPVVKTAEALGKHPHEQIVMLVETAVSRENVSRLAGSRGYAVAVEHVEGGFQLLLTPKGAE